MSKGGAKPAASKAALFGEEQLDSDPRDLLGSVGGLDVSGQRRISLASDTANQANVKSTAKISPKYSVKERQKITSETEDPLSDKMLDSYEPVLFVRNENLSIKKEDEARIVAALHSAAKKQATGAIYSVVVDLSKSGSLGIGVKDLPDHVLAVSMLKRENCCPGPGEDAGLRLGDIIFGVNFIPTREGSKTLINIIKKEAARGKSHVHVQGWRCHQLCSDAMPGYQFPRADEVLVQAYSLVQSKVFSDWERWNFIEILLGHMLEDLKMRSNQENGLSESTGSIISPSVMLRAKQMQVLDLERNILQAKGLRTALCVRIVHTKSHGDTVVYVLRVEDVESGLQWVVQRRYSDFFNLNEELLDMTHFTKEVEFPRKRLSIRNTAKLVEMRIVALEQYMRRMLHILTLYATMDASASRTLRHLQTFLGVDNYLDCVHPPVLDDQRFIELMAYRFLNDFGSEACQQCVRFITTVDLEAPIEPGPEGYMPVLNFMRDALSEVEQFVQQQHMSQMKQTLCARRPDLSEEQQSSFVRKCIRRQVEAALYLPLRRTVFRIVFSFLAAKSKKLQRAITLLQRATPKFLMVDPFVLRAPALPRTVKAFRRVIQAYLPADQGQLLIHAATTVTELHKECQTERNRLAAQALRGSVTEQEPEPEGVELPAPAPRAGSDEIDFNFISTKTPDLDIGVMTSPSEEQGRAQNGELPEPPKRPVVTKLRELFTRKKTSEDLFASSDSEGEKSPGRSRDVTPTPRRTVSTTATPTTPQRANFIQRLLPRPGASALHNPDSADNLFVDENQAFTVPVKSSDSVQDSSGSASPAPATRTMSVNGHLPTDDDLSTIQRHITGLQDGSIETVCAPLDSPPRHSLSKSIGIAAAEPPSASFERAMEAAIAVQTSDATVSPNSAEASSALSPTVPQHDMSVLVSSTQSVAPKISRVVGWDLDIPAQKETAARPLPAIPVTPKTPTQPHGVLDDLVTRNSELKKTHHSHAQEGEEEQETYKLLTAEEVEAEEQRLAGETPALSTSTSAEDFTGKGLGLGSSATSSEVSPRAAAEIEKTGKAREDGNDVTSTRDSIVINNSAEEGPVQYDAISADDFLPLFTFVLIQAGLPQLLLVKELMTALVNDDDAYGECGYYLATLEAATQHIFDLADQFELASAGTLRHLDANGEEPLDGFDGGKA